MKTQYKPTNKLWVGVINGLCIELFFIGLWLIA